MFRLTKLEPPHGWNAVLWELAIVTLLATVPALLHPVDEGT